MEKYDKGEFARFLFEKDVVIPEEVVLSSGRHSKYYLDLRKICSAIDISTLDEFFWRFVSQIDELKNFYGHKFNVVYGTSGAGAFIARGFVNSLIREYPNVLFSYGLKTEKKHGSAGGFFEGHPLTKGDNVLVVDDVLSTGQTVEKELNRLNDKGVKVLGVAVVVDRKERNGTKYAYEHLEDTFNIKVYSSLTPDDFLTVLPEDDIRRRMIVEQQYDYGIQSYNFHALDKSGIEAAIKNVIRDLLVVKDLKPEIILDLTSRRTGISIKELKGIGRNNPTAKARQVAMYLLRKSGVSFPEIGRILKRDHSSVIHGCETIEDMLDF